MIKLYLNTAKIAHACAIAWFYDFCRCTIEFPAQVDTIRYQNYVYILYWSDFIPFRPWWNMFVWLCDYVILGLDFSDPTGQPALQLY